MVGVGGFGEGRCWDDVGLLKGESCRACVVIGGKTLSLQGCCSRCEQPVQRGGTVANTDESNLFEQRETTVEILSLGLRCRHLLRSCQLTLTPPHNRLPLLK